LLIFAVLFYRAAAKVSTEEFIVGKPSLCGSSNYTLLTGSFGKLRSVEVFDVSSLALAATTSLAEESKEQFKNRAQYPVDTFLLPEAGEQLQDLGAPKPSSYKREMTNYDPKCCRKHTLDS
jgi:hypothetical protein